MKQSPPNSLMDQALAKTSSLYLIASQGNRSLSAFLAHVEAAILGGVDLVQMREKERTPQDLLDLGAELVALCHSYHVPLIVNDLVQVATAIQADGVHVGQDDMSPKEAAQFMGSTRKVGWSTHSLDQIDLAIRNEAVAMAGFGPIFATQTKDAGPALGLRLLQEALDLSDGLPLWAIGGISLENLPQVLGTGCHRIAVSSLIMNAKNPQETTQRAKALLASSS